MLRCLRVVAVAALAVALPSSSVDAAGVCYSPFYSSDYSSSNVASLLQRDFAAMAAQGFDAVRTYHAQFYGQNVVTAAQSSGLKVAIGIQMLGAAGTGEYQFLEDDIQAAIYAAKTAPQSVLAIYAGNENLIDGKTSGDRIVQVITRIKNALRGTPGERVPVGSVQRLEEWLHSADAATVAAASDVVGANIYPFFTPGGAADMKGTLALQWATFAAKFGGKARLTETGWPSQGSSSPSGNAPTQENAAKYFAAFNDWAAQTATSSPFYFMMYDAPSALGPDYEQHFGIATRNKVLKFQNIAVAKNEAAELRSHEDVGPATVGVAVDETEVETETETMAPTAAPEPTTPEPTTEMPTEVPTEVPTVTPTVTPAPTESTGSTSGSHADGHSDEIHFPSGSGSSDDASVGDGSAGVLPEPTTKYVPVSTPQATATPVVVPAATTLSPEAQAELQAKEANSKVARDVSGAGGAATTMLASVVGVAGVAAMVVIGVYMRRRNDSDEAETRTVAASSIDPRGSTPSVYDDPLGTRFSSIVMLTPNGDGVCIL